MDRKAVSDKIKELLETVKVLGEANGAKSAFDKSEDGDGAMSYNLMPGLDGLLGSEYSRVDQGDECRCIDKMIGMYISCCLWQHIENSRIYHGKKCKRLRYLPSGTMGINLGLAKIRRWQGNSFSLCWDATSSQRTFQTVFRSNTLAVRDWVDREYNKDPSVAVSGDDGYELRPAAGLQRKNASWCLMWRQRRITPFGWTGF